MVGVAESTTHPRVLFFLSGASCGPLRGVFSVGFGGFRIISSPKQCVISSCIKSSAHPVEVRKDLVLTHTPGKWGGGGICCRDRREPQRHPILH